MTTQRVLAVAIAASAAAILVDAVLYAVAVGSLLSSGPNATGYDALAAANHVAWLVAVLLAAAGVLRAAHGRRRTIASLVAATGVTLAAAVGLRVLGLTLADTEAARRSLDLQSFFLALIGSGADLMLVPVAFALAAVVAVVLGRSRAARAVGRAA